MNTSQLKILYTIVLLFYFSVAKAQKIRRIDGTSITQKQLNIKINSLVAAANISGAAVAVFNNNKVVFSNTFGFASIKENRLLTQKSIMYAASFSKTVFAFVVMQFVQEKLIDLDNPLVNYLQKPLLDFDLGKKKSFTDLENDNRYKLITARMCLSHTTGFPNWRWIETDKKLKIKFTPGTRYSYSGEGLQFLQFVIEQITGKDYETIAQERVFKPLHLYNTSQVWQKNFDSSICYGHNANGEAYESQKRKIPGAAGSMSTSFEDFTAFFSAFINNRGLSKESFKLLTTPQIRIKSKQQFGPNAWIDVDENDSIELSYGLGVGLFKTPNGNAYFKEGHDDGWGHYSICYPDKKIAIIIMTNSDNGESIFKELLAYAIGDIYTPYLWENYIPYNLKN